MDKSYILLYHGATNSDSIGIENSSGKHIKAEEFSIPYDSELVTPWYKSIYDSSIKITSLIV